MQEMGSIPGLIPWRRKWQTIPVFLPGKSHGQNELYDHGVTKDSNMTEQLDNNKNPVFIILMCSYYKNGASLVAQMVKNLLAMLETWFDPWVGKISLERRMATHSHILA